MHRCLRVAVLFVIGLLTWPTGALACGCELQPKDLHEALKSAREKADAIFRGRVTHIEPVYVAPSSNRPRLHQVTFEATETFKGKVAPQQVVATYRPDGIGCGYLLEEGTWTDPTVSWPLSRRRSSQADGRRGPGCCARPGTSHPSISAGSFPMRHSRHRVERQAASRDFAASSWGSSNPTDNDLGARENSIVPSSTSPKRIVNRSST